MVVDCSNRTYSWTGVRLPSPPLSSILVALKKLRGCLVSTGMKVQERATREATAASRAKNYNWHI